MIMTFTFLSFLFITFANFLLTQAFGIEGAAVATEGPLVLINSLAFVFLWRHCRGNSISTTNAWFTVSVAAADFLLYKIKLTIQDPGLILIPVLGLPYTTSFTLVFIIDGLEPKDKELVNQISSQFSDNLYRK